MTLLIVFDRHLLVTVPEGLQGSILSGADLRPNQRWTKLPSEYFVDQWKSKQYGLFIMMIICEYYR